MKRDIVKVIGGAVLMVLLFWWVFKGVGTDALLTTLKNASIPLLLLASFLQIVQNLFRVLRWRILLAPVRTPLPLRPLLSATFLGYLVSWIIPGRLGEVVRPAILSAREDLPLGPTMGSVLSDRLTDGFALLALLVVGLLVTPLGGQAAQYTGQIRTGALTFAAILVIPMILLLLASFRREAIEARLAGRRGAAAWIVRMILGFAQGTDALRNPRAIVPIAVYSLATWITIAVANWLGILAVGADISLGGSLVIMPMLAIGVALPTPGGAGGYHAMMKAGLVFLLGVSEPVAVSAAILVHLSFVVPGIVIGFVVLWIEKLSWGDLVAAGRKVRGLGAARPVEATS